MVATVLVIFVSVIHALIAIIEMCFWHLPKVHSRLGFDVETAKQVAPVVLRMSKRNWSEDVMREERVRKLEIAIDARFGIRVQ
jgi:hypothetical protein